MQVGAETWIPRPEFLSAVDRDTPCTAAHQWFAVWQASSTELLDAFLVGVEGSGRYTHFEQTNAAGERRDIEAVAAAPQTLTGDSR